MWSCFLITYKYHLIFWVLLPIDFLTYIYNRDVDLIFDITYANKDRSATYSYDLDEFNTNFGFRYTLSEKTSHRIILKYVFRDYSITSTKAADSIQKLSGQNADIILDNNINSNNLDSFMRPSQGSRFAYANTFSPATRAPIFFIDVLSS